jgi:hypothetical protein
MIRHTKGMRIGGEIALALPDCDCQTVLLDMSVGLEIHDPHSISATLTHDGGRFS